jgi:hypothetical protein
LQHLAAIDPRMSVAFGHVDKSSLETVDLVGHSSIKPRGPEGAELDLPRMSKAQSCMMTLQLCHLTKLQRERQGRGPGRATYAVRSGPLEG